jgi:hypothetical protein
VHVIVRSVGVVGRVMCTCVIEYHTDGEGRVYKSYLGCRITSQSRRLLAAEYKKARTEGTKCHAKTMIHRKDDKDLNGAHISLLFING